MTQPGSLRAFFKYAGGKLARASRYPKPLCRKIVEPFAGSAGYSTTYPDLDVTLIDQDERICGTWDWLIRAKAQDIMDLPIMEQGQHVDDLIGVSQEAKWYLGYRINIGASPRKTATRWNLWHASARLAVARQVHRINHWKIVHGNYDSVSEYATYFIDPPYQCKSFYREKVEDYTTLSKWVQSLSGQVIVCEGPGADWLPFEKLLDGKTHSNATARTVGELMWYRCQ